MPGEVKIAAPALLGLVAEGLDGRPPLGFRPLAAALAASIRRGDLPGGSRLPPERALATASGLSRGSVVAAYELLRQDGLVLRRQGSGTWVRASHPTDPRPAEELAAALRARRLTARVLREGDPDILDLGLSALHRPWGLDPEWFDVPLAELDHEGRHHGYLPNGVPELRDRLAEMMRARGLRGGAEQVAVTHGAQHAISLVARLLVHPGDVVAVESPTFPGAIDAFARAGARFATIATDSGGARPEDLERVLAGGDVRAVYLVPTCHSPTGSVMAPPRRARIAELVQASGTWLIEDEALAPLRFDGPPPAPISAALSAERHVLVGSLSKQVWAGLRVGWVHAPASLVSRLARLRAADDLGGPIHAQLVALASLDGLEERTESLRVELAERAELLHGLVATRLPDWTAQRPDGGLSMWCGLPLPVADAVAAVAPRLGVGVLPGTSTTTDMSGADHVRLSFAAPADQLVVAVDRLADAWSVVATTGPRP